MKAGSSISGDGKIMGEKISLLWVPSLACSAKAFQRAVRAVCPRQTSSPALCWCHPDMSLPFGPCTS